MDTIRMKPGTPLKMNPDDQATFDEWMLRVDRILARHLLGCTSADLPDCNYRDWYDNRVRPIRAANKALRNAQGGDE
jgi:hypothetical protein